jgi:hypothetical protein
MLICWILGHRLEYEFREINRCVLGLVCTRCGYLRTLSEVELNPKPWTPGEADIERMK